ncbi:MAG TPA: peptidoglycan DD-metalloendopeptidase family protein [Burkholderiales bacterium]|nr:peptidoglycan DD-metalloendopeptidase family protein [Burkholderiales bacterium]
MRRVLVIAALLAVAGCASGPPAPVVERSAARRASTKPPVKPGAPVRTVAPPTATDGYYIVQRGDTLYSIALEHGADYHDVAQWNRLDDPAQIKVGQALRVEPPPNAVQIGRAPVVARIESRPLEPASAAPSSSKPEPTPVVQPKALPEPKSPPSAAGAAQFIWPVKGKVIAGFAAPRSKGIDIDGKLGEPVIAAAAGRVTYVGSGIPGLGKLVVIKHDNGFITVYAHNRAILVKEQQAVARGQKIAELGASDSDRPKLHFQIRKGAAAVDPLRYLPAL